MGLSPIFIDLYSVFLLFARLDSVQTLKVGCGSEPLGRRPKMKIEGAEVKYSNKFNFIEYLPRSIKKTQVLS